MDNLIFEKIWQDNTIIELKIVAKSEYANAFQNCYTDSETLCNAGKMLSYYSINYDKECYVELGKKEGNYTPAFSMKLLPANELGHVKIEVDVEIADNDERAHRCCFYVNGELGLVDKMGIALQRIASNVNSVFSSLTPMEEKAEETACNLT